MAGNYSERAVGKPLKINKPRIPRRKKKDPQDGSGTPKFSGAKGSKTMRMDKPKGLLKPPAVHPHKKRAVKNSPRAK